MMQQRDTEIKMLVTFFLMATAAAEQCYLTFSFIGVCVRVCVSLVGLTPN